MKTSKLAIALAGLLAVSGTGVYAATNDTTTTEGTETTTQCERGIFGDRAAGQAALLEALGLTEAEVEAAREAGQTLPEFAEEQGITVEQFIKAMLESHEVKLATAVESGDLTQEEAAAILAEHEERFADVTSYDDLDDMRGFGVKSRHGHGPHHGGPFGGSNQDEDAPATDDNVDNQSTNSL